MASSPIHTLPAASVEIQEHVPLAPYTTLGIGGPARFFSHIAAPAQLLEAVAFARSAGLPLFVLGGGSNLLVADSGFDGLVLHLQIGSFLPLGPFYKQGSATHLLEGAAGANWDIFVRHICEQGISGVECLAGIPGLVGGSPIQNIGAYGQDVAQTIHAVHALDLETLEFVALPAAACAFSYRRSLFNTTHRDRYIVTSVIFRFDPAARPTLTYPDLARHFDDRPEPSPMEVYHAVRGIRRAKGMLLIPGEPDSRSAGSFFKNPIVPVDALTRIAGTLACDPTTIPHWAAAPGTLKLSAAWLVERAGFPRGFVLGAAAISSRHTLALINRTGSATFADITRLRDLIRLTVERRFHITLEQEPVELGT